MTGERASEPRFSVIVPTHLRRAAVCAHVRAFARQSAAPPFEVVVVVDGSTDGTAAALRALELPFSLTVVEQARSGAATARNLGARRARGEIFLFLDDDMEPDPELLAAHDRRHAQGADAVLGHMPVHPDSPKSFLSAATDRWVEHRRRTLSASESVPGELVLSGHLSVSRSSFERVGGFDERFTRAGAYGGEDTDFGLRLERAGARIVYEPRAVSRQLYDITLRGYLRRKRDAGRATVALLRKHPDLPDAVVRRRVRLGRFDRWLGRYLYRAVEPPLVALLERGVHHRRLERLYFWLQSHHYWHGVRAAGGYPRRSPLRVLAYHSLRELSAGPEPARFAVAPAELVRQLRWLTRLGFRFVSPAELVHYFERGAGVPRRGVLLTFDDAYADLVTAGLPILRRFDAPGAVFAVGGQVGGYNAWDERHGAPLLALCAPEQLRELARHGVEVGSHGQSHAPLDRLGDAELAGELCESAAALEALGLERPRLLAFPYGRAGARERRAAAAAGYRLAFTVRPGLVTPASDPLALPRIEIQRADRGLRFVVKVLRAGRSPFGGRRGRRA